MLHVVFLLCTTEKVGVGPGARIESYHNNMQRSKEKLVVLFPIIFLTNKIFNVCKYVRRDGLCAIFSINADNFSILP